MATDDFTNNFYMAKTFATTHPEIVAILRGHPLYPALSKKVTVPQTFLNQLWTSLTYVPGTVTETEFFYFKLTSGGTFRLRFDLDLFRRAIGFPLSNAYPDKNTFENIPPDATIVDAINALGYDGRFNKVSEFHRNSFTKRWCILFMILNRCLTHSYSGLDSLSKPIAQILYGVAYHRHFDFAHIIWKNLIKIVNKKHKFDKYTPYIRFLSILLDHFLTTNPQIPVSPNDPPVVLSSMKYTQDNTGSNSAQPAPIPHHLLLLADRTDKSILRYRELVARMEPVQPQAPTPRAHSQPGEGSSMRGSKRKNKEGKINEGDLGEITAREKRQKYSHEPIIEQIHPIPPSESPDISIPESTIPTSQDHSPSPSTSRIKTHRGHHKRKSHKHKRVLEIVPEEAQLSFAQPSNVPTSVSEDAEHQFDDNIFDFDSITPASALEIQGGNEGVVENSLESELSGRVKGRKENVCPPQTTPKSRATTSATETHALRPGIEEVTDCPPVHAQTPHSHSVSQQREIVSSVHGELPHTLPASPLESRGIETRGTQPQPRPSFRAQVSSTPSSRSVMGLSGSAHLRDVAGTSVGAPVSTVLQGSLGNPTSVNITPTLTVGHSTQLSGALVVSPESIRGSGRTFSLAPAFESHFTDLTREQVTLQSTNISSSLPPSTSTPPIPPSTSTPPIPPSTSTPPIPPSTSTPPIPPSSSTHRNPYTQPLPPHLSHRLNPQHINFTDLKALFHAKLLIHPNRSPIEQAMLALLNADLQSTTPPPLDLSPVLSRLDQIDSRLASLESCRPFPAPSGRRHDDPDSQDPPEGENRGTGSSYERFSTFPMAQDSGEGTSRGSQGGAQEDQGFDYSEFDEDWEQPEPLNMVFPEPVLLIEFGNLTEPMTVEKPEVNMSSQEKATVPTTEELESYLRDDSEQEPENAFEFDNLNESYEEQPISPELPPGFENIFDQTTYNEIHSPEENVLQMLNHNLCQNQQTDHEFLNPIKRFFKDRNNQLDLHLQQLDRILEAPFIEEQAYKIFSKNDLSPRSYNNLGENAFKGNLQIIYRGLMKRMINDPPLEVGQIQHKIEVITHVECQRICKINIPIIHVYRSNGQKYTFNEAHFHLLHVNDIMDMYHHFTNAIVRPYEMLTALNAVKRFIKFSIQAASKEDFQLGLESVQRKINLSTPNQALPSVDLQSVDFCSVLTTPEFGFVFMNGRTERNFIRIREMHKYSDGTLCLALKCFRWRIQNKDATAEQLPLIKDVMKRILGRLKFRVAMRQFEVIQGLRKKPYFTGSTAVRKYQPRWLKGPYNNYPDFFTSEGPFLPNDPRNPNPQPI